MTIAKSKIEHFEIERKIGSGQFSVVKLATHIHTKQTVALKILNRKKIDELSMTTERVRREVDNLRLCSGHPHIMRLYDVYDGLSTDEDTILVTEFGTGGTLYDLMTQGDQTERLSIGKVRYFFQQIVSGLEHMHSRGVAHRDLTLDNILLTGVDRDVCKLADFGFSRKVPDGDGKMITSCGSPNYAAPELLITAPSYDGLAVDVWSLGVILYIMLTGCLPFQEEKYKDLFHRIRNGIYTMPRFLNKGAKELIPSMLHVDVTTRITIEGVRMSNFNKKALPEYLKQPSEDLVRKSSDVDPEIVKEVLKFYDMPIAHTNVLSNDKASLEMIRVTNDLVEQVVRDNQHGQDEEARSDVARELQLHYNLLLQKKKEDAHNELLLVTRSSKCMIRTINCRNFKF